MSKTKRRMKKRHEPHELNRNLHSNFYFNSLPLLYFLSTFPIKGPVRATQRVSTYFAEGQYVLFAGSPQGSKMTCVVLLCQIQAKTNDRMNPAASAAINLLPQITGAEKYGAPVRISFNCLPLSAFQKWIAPSDAVAHMEPSGARSGAVPTHRCWGLVYGA